MINTYDKDTIVTELISKARGNSGNPFSFGAIENMPTGTDKICRVRVGDYIIVNALMTKTAQANSSSGSRVVLFNLAGVYCVLDVLY